MPTYKAGRATADQRGFSYALVLAAIVIVGIAVEAGYIATAHTIRKDREAELLFRGEAYRRAIQSYYEAGGVRKMYPPSLDHLVRDPRAPNRRHLRALYDDPLAKGEKREWNLVRAPDGGISGVTSTSQDEPLKQANFPKSLEAFTGAKTYADWVFEYRPTAPLAPQLPPRTATAGLPTPQPLLTPQK